MRAALIVYGVMCAISFVVLGVCAWRAPFEPDGVKWG